MDTSREPFDHPAAWKATELAERGAFAQILEPRHLEAFEAALAAVRRRGLGLEEMGTADFPLESIAADVAGWRETVLRGRGLLMLRGFPVDRLSRDDLGLVFFGLGLHLGRPVSQSNLGDLLGHVTDVGGKDARERAYRNSRELSLHTDRCDHLGMLCLQRAKSGGVSGYASALAIHNEILATRPELLEPLYAGFHHHRFGEQPPGESPVTAERIPIFSVTGGVPCVIYIRGYIDLAAEEYGFALSELEREALDHFEAVANRPDLRLDVQVEPGEGLFFNNCTVLHTRTAFDDHPEPERKRHFLRLWLMEDGRPAAPGVKAHKGDGGIPRIEGRGTYYEGRAEA